LFLVQASVYNPANYRGEVRDLSGRINAGLSLLPKNGPARPS
jgi:hypothetical protein